MVLNIILFILGLALIIKGGDFFVDSSVWLAKALRIPTFIIGATIVSMATTMPELLVSCIAAAEGQTEMAVGNAVGSVTANTALILAIAMLAMPILCARKQYMKQCILLMLSAAVILFGCWLGKSDDGYALHIAASIVLIAIFAYFMFENIRGAKKKDEPDLSDSPVLEQKKEPIDKKKLAINILLFVIGAAGIVGGSRLMVDNGEAIAIALGVPERVIAVTLVAIGTSLPELVTTITAIVKKEGALSAGNVIGANIIDLTLILPISSLIAGKPLPVSNESFMIDLPLCLGVSIIAMLPIILMQKTSRVQGAALLAVYGGYIAYLIINLFV